jgi:SAM-dependent methyltransferase
VFGELIRHPGRFGKYIVRRILQIPSRGLPRVCIHRQDDFDRKYGVDTFSLVRAIETKSPNLVHGNKYEASSEAAVRWSIENCGMPLEETIFVDIGCGKGRALIIAAMYPFKKIVGIEYSSELASICCRNLDKLHIRDRCEVVIADAAEVQFPNGALLAFLYYPFDETIYGCVLKNLSTMPGRIRLANHGPGKDTIERSGIVIPIASGESTTLYEIVAQHGQACNSSAERS